MNKKTLFVKTDYWLDMLPHSICAVFFLILLASNSSAGDLVDLVGIDNLEKVAPALRAKLKQDAQPGRIKAKREPYRLIVSLRAKESPAEFGSAFSTRTSNKSLLGNIKQAQSTVFSSMNDLDLASYKVLTPYTSLYGFSAEANLGGICRLTAIEEVVYVEEMPLYYTMDAEAFTLTDTALSHSSGWTGKGITIAIIDDGIDHNHAAFGGFSSFPNAKVVGGYDFADYDNNPTNDCAGQSHGTAVAGVAVGNGGGITGTAPDAKLVFLKLQKASNCGQPWLDGDIIAAIDWAITNRNTYGIKVISMSLGSNSTSSIPCSGSAAANALTAARNAGLIVVAAAGNSASIDGLSDPACHPDAVSVGAVYDANLGYVEFRQCTDWTTQADKVACYSNSADFLDILAPSHCATTAQADGGINTCFGGTSSATPYVAGVVATLFEKNPTLTQSAAVAALVNSGYSITDSRNGLTIPRVHHSTSLSSLGGGGSGITPLTNGSAVSGLADELSENKLFALSVPAGATDLKFQLFGGSGDADLYVRFGMSPTTSMYDCGANNATNDETCIFQNPNAGIYYVLIYSDTSYSGLTLEATYIEHGSSLTTNVLTNGVAVTGLAGAEMTNSYYSLAVPGGATNLRIQISDGNGDADLHVKYGSVPSASTYDCRPFLLGNDEVCRIESANAGKYHIMIQAYSSYSGLTLRGSYDWAGRGKAVVAPVFFLLK